jgi:lysophospholipase L1-like esterase
MLAALCLVLGLACGDESAPVGPPAPKPAVKVSMLALGDSYTSGESVALVKSWPYQLETALVADSVLVASLKVIAHTGWTTSDLILALNKNAKTLTPPYDVVTLQIGVNNQYKGLPVATFLTEFPELVARATRLAGDRASHVVVLSIPDYSVTPVGSIGDQGQNQREINEYNGYIETALDSTDVHLVNVTDISREAQDDSSLVARDGLHPSAKMYAAWVDVIRPVVARIFGRGAEADTR